MTQSFEVRLRFDSLPDVARGLAVPDYIGNVGRRMIKGRDFYALVVCGCDEGVTRSQTCADNSELVIALLLKPIEAAADINHALPHGIERTADVGGDGVICAADFGGHADIVIRHGEPQHRNTQHIQEFAQAHIGDGIGVPVRKENDCAAPSRGKPARIYQIIFGIWRFHRRSEAQEIRERAFYLRFQLRVGNFPRGEDFNFTRLQAKIGWRLVGKELVAGDDDATIEIN